ncbi:AI-2E family transporter [Humibacter ginsenosidimutans]|uniref:AI-2E family transporter n=1 Tax=Humibacter ginsenosidimutans TaxID=2599293 RepID=A0A5B8M3A5_9MICO|nr:AI-2E family transporter [Humibacter ginsenosidimutans]QDZ14265.1 AI-2E family transporter [Humibacter ginsenosidimutans]
MPDPTPAGSQAPDSPRSSFGPGARAVIVFAAFGVAVACLWLGRDILAPALTALVVVVAVHPVRNRLDATGAPRWLGTTVVVVTAYAVLIVIGGLIAFAAVQFGHLVTDQGDAMGAMHRSLNGLLDNLGIDQSQLSDVTKTIDPSTLASFAGGIVRSVFSSAVAFFFVLAYIIFMAADGSRTAELRREFADRHGLLLDALARWAHGVRAYFVVNSIFGAIVAVLDGVVLVALGVPGVPVWIVLAFVTNYVPNIGFVIGMIPPVLLALITAGWPQALAVVVAYCVINVVLQELVQPRFVATTVSLGLTLTFFSVVFWAVVLGAIGALLAVPMTLLVRALVVEIDPDARWSRWITGDRRGASG